MVFPVFFVCLFVCFCLFFLFCFLFCLFFSKGKISKKPRALEKWTFLARMGQSSAYRYGG